MKGVPGTMRKKAPPVPSVKQLQEDARRAELSLARTAAEYAERLLKTLKESDIVTDSDRANWDMVYSGRLAEGKDISGLGVVTDLAEIRKASYRAWRLDPHGRGILRHLVKFVIGRGPTIDPLDTQRGRWNKDKTRLEITSSEDDSMMVKLVWGDFVANNRWRRRAKEFVLRGFRDGEVALRRFVHQGRVFVRFIEPDQISTPSVLRDLQVLPEDLVPELEMQGVEAGAPTEVVEGVERLKSDVETVIAYYVAPNPTKREHVRVSGADVIHRKICDLNDPRGVPILESVLKKLMQYEQWEEYRIILNKVRTAIALVRHVDGTSAQASNIVAGRQPAASSPTGRDPQTTSGRREAGFRPGTILTPTAGVKYEFINPRLDARDAGEDGRRILLTAGVGVGLPEMLISGDFSNAAYASTASAMSVVQREWEDWQDDAEEDFNRVFNWVIDAAIETLGLPAETNRTVVWGWPTMFEEDKVKATERREKLFAGTVLSRRTWAAQEGLVFDDEQDNRRDDGDDALPSSEPDLSSSPNGAQKATEERVYFEAVEQLSLLPDDSFLADMGGILDRAVVEQRRVAAVQALLFDKTKYSAALAQPWAKAHGFQASRVDDTREGYRLRQRSPQRFVRNSSRILHVATGVRMVIGQLKYVD